MRFFDRRDSDGRPVVRAIEKYITVEAANESVLTVSIYMEQVYSDPGSLFPGSEFLSLKSKCIRIPNKQAKFLKKRVEAGVKLRNKHRLELDGDQIKIMKLLRYSDWNSDAEDDFFDHFFNGMKNWPENGMHYLDAGRDQEAFTHYRNLIWNIGVSPEWVEKEIDTVKQFSIK